VVRCEVRSPVQQVAEFLEAVAERALFARRDDQGAAFEASRGPLEDRVFDDRLQEFSGADLDEQGAALLLEGSSVRCEFLEPAGDLFWQRASVMPLQEVGYVPEVFAALHLVQHTSSIEPVPMITLLDGEPAELQAQVRGERSGGLNW
jgi:hypothetical protein